MTPQKFDKNVLFCAVALIAVYLLILLAVPAKASAGQQTAWVTEQRAERLIEGREAIGLQQTLCLGIGKVRGVKERRYRRFVCSAFVYPDIHVIMRVRWLSNGDYELLS